MRSLLASVLFVTVTGCSFVGVRGPARTTEPPTNPDAIRCTESGVLPGLDALGGAAAIALVGGGVIDEITSEDGSETFDILYAAPVLALGLAYFYSASWGNDRTTRCTELKEQARKVQPVVRPIDAPPQADDAEKPPAL